MHTLKRLILLFLIIVSLFIGWFIYYINVASYSPSTPYEFSIKPGSNLKDIAEQLNATGILSNAWSFILLSRVMGYESSLKAGDYEITEAIPLLQLLKRITDGTSSQSEIKFIEGWTFRQLRQSLDAHPAIRHDTKELNDKEILRMIGANETIAEGLFFPDTYFFSKNSSDIGILKRAYRGMQSNLISAWKKKDQDLFLKNAYQALILASIVEKETGKEEDRATIAGVFINRLRLGMPLQTDPTVIYGLGEKFNGNLRKIDLLTDHTYNTYTRLGLPPTPISMPGMSSILATLNPAKTDALYFVAKGNGKSHFSNNLADHNRAVAKYQKR